jgi:predicted flap endonuclease-1-like 5' DNA nuclease
VRELEAELRLAHEGEYPEENPEVLSGISQLWGLQKKGEPRIQQAQGTQEPASVQASSPESSEDDLQLINGIGPTYERRLKEAGILTFADLAAQTPEKLRELTGLQEWQSAAPEQWLSEAKDLSEN